MQLTVTGDLLLGLPYKGQLYYVVRVSALTMGAECRALETIAELELTENTPERVREVLAEFAYLREQIEVVDIPKAELTPHYLLEHLTTDDYGLITGLILDLRKKRMLAGEKPKVGEELNVPA